MGEGKLLDLAARCVIVNSRLVLNSIGWIRCAGNRINVNWIWGWTKGKETLSRAELSYSCFFQVGIF